MAGCKNCGRFTAVPYLHSFSASLEQCKNQSWHSTNAGWIVTPTSSEAGTQAVSNAAFCSGECLYSYLFSRDLLSNKSADAALHFFKRVDAQRHPPRTGANGELLRQGGEGMGDLDSSPDGFDGAGVSGGLFATIQQRPLRPQREGAGQLMGAAV